jgi:hypothetical protein
MGKGRGYAAYHERRELEAQPLLSEELASEIERNEQYGGNVAFLEYALWMPEPKTGTLNFRRFPFQPAIYEALGSNVRNVVIRKATQVGISAALARWAIHEADRNGRTVLYVFPTKTDVFDYADARIKPMIERSDYLATRIGDPNNKGLRRIGRGWTYWRGSENKRALDSVDADCLALDEYDTLNQAHVPDAERRVSGLLSAGLIRRIGVPSLPQFGIAEQYDESDQRRWLARCTRCDYRQGDCHETKNPLVAPRGTGWQEVDFWENVDQPRKLVVCAGCGEQLDVGAGQWVAQNPDSNIVGFHVSRLTVPGFPLEDMIRNSKKTSPEQVEVFYNKDLGRPYVSKDARLSLDEIRAAQREFALVPGYGGSNLVTMGVDVATERALNVRISEHHNEQEKHALWIGEIEDSDQGYAFQQLADLMERYRVNMACIDHEPEGRLARAICEQFPGRIYLVALSGTIKDPMAVDDDQRKATVRRTNAFDAMTEMMRRQHNLLPIALPEGYEQHLTANVRRVQTDALGNKKTWWEPTRPDDYAQAEVYDLVASEMFYRRVLIDHESRYETRPLDDMIEFRRSNVTEYDDHEWLPGPELEPEYEDADLEVL